MGRGGRHSPSSAAGHPGVRAELPRGLCSYPSQMMGNLLRWLSQCCAALAEKWLSIPAPLGWRSRGQPPGGSSSGLTHKLPLLSGAAAPGLGLLLEIVSKAPRSSRNSSVKQSRGDLGQDLAAKSSHGLWDSSAPDFQRGRVGASLLFSAPVLPGEHQQ